MVIFLKSHEHQKCTEVNSMLWYRKSVRFVGLLRHIVQVKLWSDY